MALRGHAGYSTGQMVPLVLDMAARAVSWKQKVGYSEQRHHDLELIRRVGAPCPEEAKVRCWWTLASLREEPMGRRQVPCLAAAPRPLLSRVFGVLVHVPSHYGLHALSSRVRLDLARVAWYFYRPAKLVASVNQQNFHRTHFFLPWVTGAFPAW
jgi:hypothetical protein